MMKHIYILFFAIAILPQVQAQVYKNKQAPAEERARDLLSKMTLEEKIDYIGGFNGFYIRGIERLGLPEIKLTDGPVGTHKDGKAVAYPASVLSAATWDTGLVYNLGKQLARDSRSRGVHVLLAPGINIIRSPLGGRNFEYFSEDPYLTSRMAVAYVKGLQQQGVVATVKHFALNNQEWDRNNVSSDVDERTLHEIYLPAFKAAVQEAHAGSIMNSYNLVNGVHATQSDFLNNQILKNKWGFDGFVMSDWSATYDAVAAANGGLDLEMPSPKYMNKKNLLPAIQSGAVKETTIDDKVLRILRIVFRFGFFDKVQLDTTIPRDNPEGAQLALELARAGIVLLKNDKHILPAQPESVRSIAVIGGNANNYIAGGGSSYTFPFKSVSVLEGIRNAYPNVKVAYSAGMLTLPETVAGSVFYTGKGSTERGLKAEYYANTKLTGIPLKTTVDTIVTIENGWHIATENKGTPFDHCSMRWTGVIRPPKTARYRFVVKGFDGFRLKLDTTIVINEWRDQGITTREVVVPLEAGKEYPVLLEYFANVHPVDISFGWREDKLLFDEAIALARQSDLAIVNIGFNESSERESNDRSFDLPEYQDSLVQCIADANLKTIVLLNAGGNVDMTRWIDKVPALLHIWYPGQEGGTAVGEILSGKVNPGGKLPVSFERKWADNPACAHYYDSAGNKRVFYKEGLFMGYRYYDQSIIKPMFPFGYGLSYTTFDYTGLKAQQYGTAGNPHIKLLVNIRNTGAYDGAEVVQVYVRPLHPKIIRPYKELKSFAKIFIKKGEAQQVTITLDKNVFSYYKTGIGDFDFDAGAYEILVGSSAADIRLKKVISLKK
ncbi:MAG: glycoside hydrolase family 3 C-terminal domain-containing protein [Niabella sp.]